MEHAQNASKGAIISYIDEDSPAYYAGFVEGCVIIAVDGHPVRDIIDWRWLSAEECIEIEYVDTDGDSGSVMLEREEGQDWGFSFEDAVFDDVKLCKNACTFCFMRQLPKGMRKSLSMRDDDFRLSFLTGTFITLTNLENGDIERIIEQRISPLRVSLHAVDADVRLKLIGKNAPQGMRNLERLLDAGIEFDAQVVLVPGVNDGEVLNQTIEWAYAHPGIKTLGIVPLGFTRFQDIFDRSFDDADDALAVIRQIEPAQKRAIDERGYPWVYAADEFYRNAYSEKLLENLPDTDFYDDFSMYEDGIGIIRSACDAFEEAVSAGIAEKCATELRRAHKHAVFIAGEAMEPYFSQLIAKSPLKGVFSPLVVKNDFFGGNVNVTGLLCGCDIARAIAEDNHDEAVYFIPDVVFNTDGVTLDGLTATQIRELVGADRSSNVYVAASNPLDYMAQIAKIVRKPKCPSPWLQLLDVLMWVNLPW